MLTVSNISLRYDNDLALEGVNLTVDNGEVLAVLGPSGSGKSSLLRVIAGLEKPQAGTIHLDGYDITNAAVHERSVGLMFQDYALFPHLNVSQNVSFGLRIRRRTHEHIEKRTREVLDWVGLDDFDHRSIDSLSGGEQQRVALARALAPTPAVMLLDEPVGALDRALRARLVPEMASILRSVSVPTIYVTHDQDEAFAIADRVAVLQDGRVAQWDRPEVLWRAPANEFVARFLGFENVADVRVRGKNAVTPWGAVPTQLPEGNHRVIAHPDALRVDAEGALVGEVRDIVFIGGRYRLTISCLNHDLVVLTHDTPTPVGTQVRVGVADDALVAISPEPRGGPLYTTSDHPREETPDASERGSGDSSR